MGTDIRWVVEVRFEDRWLGILSSDIVKAPVNRRDYEFFSEFRDCGESGVPEDVSDLARYVFSQTDDIHSHGWVYLCAFLNAHRQVYRRRLGLADYADVSCWNLLGEDVPLFDWVEDDCGTTYRVVYAFSS